MGVCPGWCGLCYEAKKGRRYTKGHYGYRAPPQLFWEVRDMLRRNKGTNGKCPPGSRQVVCPCDMEDSPTVFEFLTSEVWTGTKDARVTGTILVFVDDSGIKAMLNDRDAGLVAFVLCDPSRGILESVEAALESESTDWRPSKQQRAAKK